MTILQRAVKIVSYKTVGLPMMTRAIITLIQMQLKNSLIASKGNVQVR